MRPVFDWNIGSRTLPLGKRTLLMGVVNVTPDSFSDSGLHVNSESALDFALQLLADSADIIDVGGESTRPGVRVAVASSAPPSPAKAVTEDEELRRILPVIDGLRKKRPDAIISVDTYKSNVALAAVAAGANIVNDVSGFTWDPSMVRTLAGLKCGVVLVHTRGMPDEWRDLPIVADIVMLVKRDLRDRAEAAVMAGVKRDRIVLDPGFGFGKNFEENFPLLKRFEELHQLRYPLAVGVSRKGFIGRALAREGKDAALPDRLYGTLATETASILKGAHIIRTHDVRACADAVRIADLVAN